MTFDQFDQFDQYWEEKGCYGANPEEVAKLAWDAAVAAERERCAKIADERVPADASPIGPLFGAGIGAAARSIAAKIRSGE